MSAPSDGARADARKRLAAEVVTPDEQIVAVLIAHDGFGYIERVWQCTCGYHWPDERPSIARKTHAAHVAAALAGVIADAKAEAWDEAHDASCSHIPKWCGPDHQNPYGPAHSNPYRTKGDATNRNPENDVEGSSTWNRGSATRAHADTTSSTSATGASAPSTTTRPSTGPVDASRLTVPTAPASGEPDDLTLSARIERESTR